MGAGPTHGCSCCAKWGGYPWGCWHQQVLWASRGQGVGCYWRELVPRAGCMAAGGVRGVPSPELSPLPAGSWAASHSLRSLDGFSTVPRTHP